MKIFATSDIHGNKALMAKLKEMSAISDLVLICGDVGGKEYFFRDILDFSAQQRKDAEYLDSLLSDIGATSRFILGNDDWFEYDGGNYLSKSEDIGGEHLVPFEYVGITPFNTNREANENKLRYELGKLTCADGSCPNENSIIVAHMPPYGAGDVLYNGSHCGSKAIRQWIEGVQPKLWLCGHIHEDFGMDNIGGTIVLNCACRHERNIFAGWLIDTETLDIQAIKEHV